MNQVHSKLVLGTVKFGMDYGLGDSSQVLSQTVSEILNLAWHHGVNALDTAIMYGQSERVLGEYLAANPDQQFQIISKIPPCQPNEVRQQVEASLRRLNQDHLHGYLVHDVPHLFDHPQVWRELEQLKQEGLVSQIGLSCYYPREIKDWWERGYQIDFVQVPINVLDQRFLELLEELACRGVTVYARSIFLQGLLMTNPDALSSHFQPIADTLIKLRQLAGDAGLTLADLCLLFVASHSRIDHLVIGIDKPELVTTNLETLRHLPLESAVIDQLNELRYDNEQILVAKNWPAGGVVTQDER